MTNSAWPRTFLFGISFCLVAFAGAELYAQDPASQPPPADGAPSPTPDLPSDVELELRPGQRPLIRLAFPTMERAEPLSSAIRDAGSELERTLRSDLEATRVFEIQGPEMLRVLELTGEASTDYELYRSLQNEILVEGRLLEENGRLTFEGRAVDLASGSTIVGKRYRGRPPLARRIAHTFADEILDYLTGRRGIALTSIAFTTDRDQDGRKEIYLMDYDGANARRLTGHRSTSMSPSWSPTSDALAYTSFFGGAPGVYLADLGSGAKRPVATDGGFNVSPTFSPDGRRVAYARSLDGNTEIFVSDRDGSNRRRLTHTRAIDTNPAWSPKGNEIAFTSSRAGNPQIYAMDPEGTNVRRLTFGGAYSDNVAWHPEGTKIAYTTRIDNRFRIAVTDVVTLETRVLTSGVGEQEDPTFSPDGRWIAFTWKRGPGRQIWVMDAETGDHLRQLTRVGNNETPDWSPYSAR